MPSPTSSVDSLDTTLNPRIDSSVPPTQTPLFKAFTLRVLPVDLPTPSDTMGECSVSAYGVRGATTGSSLLEDQTNFVSSPMFAVLSHFDAYEVRSRRLGHL